MVGEEDYPDEVEERLVNEEYKIWKKNTPFLYGESCSRELRDIKEGNSCPSRVGSYSSGIELRSQSKERNRCDKVQ